MRKLTLGLAAALTLAATTAGAHPKLLSAQPAPGAAVAGSPREISITFSEAIFPRLSGLTVTGPAGTVAKTGGAGDPKDRNQLVVPLLATLPPGQYRVDWHAVSTDTHHVKGQFDFPVK
ncbi:MAG: copper homeostasis periplasmic binding protein CopC [Phenylobacterium sp.]